MKILQFKKHLVTRAPDVLPSMPSVKGSEPVFQKIEKGDLEKDTWLGERKKVFSQFLNEGHLGFQLVDSLTNECVAYGWLAFEGTKPNHLPSIPPDVGWLHYDRVKDGYQGRGYHKLMLLRRLKFIQDNFEDITVYTDTYVDNLSARWAQKKVGFVEAGVYHVISLGTRRVPFCFWQYGRWNRHEKHPPL